MRKYTLPPMHGLCLPNSKSRTLKHTYIHHTLIPRRRVQKKNDKNIRRGDDFVLCVSLLRMMLFVYICACENDYPNIITLLCLSFSSRQQRQPESFTDTHSQQHSNQRCYCFGCGCGCDGCCCCCYTINRG